MLLQEHCVVEIFYINIVVVGMSVSEEVQIENIVF